MSELRYEKSTQTILCTTTGGPATTVTWRRDGSSLSLDGSTYQSSQIILDTASSTYQNVLTFTGPKSDSLSGTYTYLVENLRGSASLQLTVTGNLANTV